MVQMPLKHWHAWGIDPLSGKPIPVFDQLLSKEMLPKVQHKHRPVQLWTVVANPITGCPDEENSISLFTFPPQESAESNKVAPQPPFLKLDKARSVPSPWLLPSPFTSFVALPWMHSRIWTSSLNSGGFTGLSLICLLYHWRRKRHGRLPEMRAMRLRPGGM